MLSDSTAVTVLGHKVPVKKSVHLVVVAAFIGLLSFITWLAVTNEPESGECAFRVPDTTLSTSRSFDSAISRGECIRLGRATTDQDREQGLSGRDSMPLDEGLLFVFDRPQQACMWMKDMRFSLDMVWLDSAKTIQHIEANVSPGSYPKNFCGNGQTSYVIEINAGQTSAARLRVGRQLHF